jgi:pimeloyl-ACP methyl ester carboxylesterase
MINPTRTTVSAVAAVQHERVLRILLVLMGIPSILIGLLPHAQVEQWPGLGHMVHLAEPDKFAELVASFARTGPQVAWR